MVCFMIPISYDLHMHSILSPCGDEDMTPYNIVAMAKLKGLDAIALTDHNSSKNCPAFMYHGEKMGILTIPGMELCTLEEVHVVLLFPSLTKCMEFDRYVETKYFSVLNKEEIFGAQIILDEKENEIGRIKELLINATKISIFNLSKLIKPYGGVMIPAHIDKSTNSLISNLGFVPKDLGFYCYEIKDRMKEEKIKEQNFYLEKCKVVYNSDAHYLEHIKEVEDYIHVKGKTIEQVIDALKLDK